VAGKARGAFQYFSRVQIPYLESGVQRAPGRV